MKTKKRPIKQKVSVKNVLGAVGALSGIASGSLFAYHERIISTNPADVSNSFGYLLLLVTISAWIGFAVYSIFTKNK